MAAVRGQTVSSLNSLTCGDFYRRLVAGLGQQISVKQIQQDNVEQMVRNLLDQQSRTSGVDINEEAAQLLIYEQMFQAMAKYIATVQSSLASLMEIV
jgi:flagellar hook-associated protein 1 FlgK